MFGFFSLSPLLSNRLIKLTWLFLYAIYFYLLNYSGKFCFSLVSLTYCSSPWPPLYLPGNYQTSGQQQGWMSFFITFQQLRSWEEELLWTCAALAGILNHILWVTVNVLSPSSLPSEGQGLLIRGLWLAPPAQQWPWRTARPVSPSSLSWDPQWYGEQLLLSEFPHYLLATSIQIKVNSEYQKFFLTHLFSLLFLGSGCCGKQD